MIRASIRLSVWLVERLLPPDLADHVAGDLIEQRQRGSWWIARQTIAAVALLRPPPHHGDPVMRRFLYDMRIGARHLRRAPAFAAAAIITLGISIGASAAIFSVVEPVLLRPLPYPSPDRLAFVWERNADGTRDNVGFQTIRDLADQSTTIEQWAAIGSWEPTLGGDRPERVIGDRVSWSYFRTLGVRPALGRDFLAEEDQPGRFQEVMLSFGLWQRRFGGDSSVIGRSIPIGGTSMTIVGVMPATFDNVVSPEAEIWRVLGYAPSQPFACRTCHHLRMIARFKPGVSPGVASAELDRIHARLERAYPAEYASVGTSVVPMQREVARDYRGGLLALAGAVVLVLLIAMANVVNLQLARAVHRREEFAIRTALGAVRSRLTSQLLAEGLVLALAGGVAGLIVARIALPLLVRYLPPALPRLNAIHLDGFGFAAVAGLVLVLSLVMAVVPGSARRGGELAESLRSGRRFATAVQHLTRSSLVVVEVALAAMLLASATLVARSLVRLLDVNAGFDPSNVLSLEVGAVGPKYADASAVHAYWDRVRAAVAAVPGVASVALTNQLPLAGNVDRYGVVDPENPPPNLEAVPSGDRYAVTPEYRSTMRIPLVRGRWFTAQEARDTANHVVAVSTSLAARMWPGLDPIGRHMRVGGDDAPVRTVIGVVGDVKHTGLDATTTLGFYVPERQWLFVDNDMLVVARTSIDPASVAAAVRRAVSAIDMTLPIIRVSTMEQLIARSTAQRRLALVLFAAFAAAALLLAVAGIYGVVAGSVAERTREIGLRSALGASPGAIVQLVMRQGAMLGATGLILGLVGGAALTRYLRTFLFGIDAGDPVTLALVGLVLGAVTLAACAGPAMRAVRIDPSEALRTD